MFARASSLLALPLLLSAAESSYRALTCCFEWKIPSIQEQRRQGDFVYLRTGSPISCGQMRS